MPNSSPKFINRVTKWFLKRSLKIVSCHANIQYDVYKSTKEVLKEYCSNQEDKLQHHLTSQGFFFSNVIKYSLSSVNSINFGQRPSLINPRTFTILPSTTSWQLPPYAQEYGKMEIITVLIAPFALILNHFFTLSLVVNSTLLTLPGDTTQSLTSLPSHSFNS